MVFVYHMYAWTRRKCSDLLGLALQTAVSFYVGVGN